MNLPLDHHFLDSPPHSGADSPAPDVARQHGQHRDRRICCATCHAAITDAASRMEVDGRHEHTFFNPAGVVFHILVFSAAPGCRGVGAFSSEFSWFAGQLWQIALCAACGQHLGWHFDGESTFTALISQRIEECAS